MSEDLIAFLNARLDEDEAAAKAVEDRSDPWPGQWVADGNHALRTYNGWVLAASVPAGSEFAPGVLAHIARHDPARALREVEAKRKLIAFALKNAVDVDGEWGDGHEAAEIASGQCDDHGAEAANGILGPLVSVYSDHPDYRPEWAPSGESVNAP